MYDKKSVKTINKDLNNNFSNEFETIINKIYKDDRKTLILTNTSSFSIASY